jgi:hypothetical protein
MKTEKLVKCVKSIDEKIPEANKEVITKKTNDIKKDAANAVFSAGATIMWTGLAVKDTLELTTIVSKTMMKKAFNATREAFDSHPLMMIYR